MPRQPQVHDKKLGSLGCGLELVLADLRSAGDGKWV